MATEGTNNIQLLFQDILNRMKASEERADAKFGKLEGRLEQLTTSSNYFEKEMLKMSSKLEAMDNESLLMKSEVQEMRTSFSENPEKGSSPEKKREKGLKDRRTSLLGRTSPYDDEDDEETDDDDEQDDELKITRKVSPKNTSGSSPGKRRLSMTSANLGATPTFKDDTGQGVTVIVEPYRIDPKDKIEKITPRSMKRLGEIYREYQNSSLDRTKTLIKFIHQDAQKELLRDQKLKRTTIGLKFEIEDMHLFTDEDTERICSDFIRPQGRQAFVELCQDTWTKIDWKPGLVINTANYHKNVYGHICKFLD